MSEAQKQGPVFLQIRKTEFDDFINYINFFQIHNRSHLYQDHYQD
jgi:hypothetical protein